MTWTIPIFVDFYLLAPFILPKIHNCKSSIFVWCIFFIVSLLMSVLTQYTSYRCPLLFNLHVFFLGCVIYFALQEKITNSINLMFLCFAILSIIFKGYGKAFIFLFSTITVLLIQVENSLKINNIISKLILVLDEYSFSLYLMQGIVFYTFANRLRPFLSRFEIIITRWQMALFIIVGTFIATYFGHNIIEKQIQKIFSKKISN